MFGGCYAWAEAAHPTGVKPFLNPYRMIITLRMSARLLRVHCAVVLQCLVAAFAYLPYGG